MLREGILGRAEKGDYDLILVHAQVDREVRSIETPPPRIEVLAPKPLHQDLHPLGINPVDERFGMLKAPQVAFPLLLGGFRERGRGVEAVPDEPDEPNACKD